MRISTRFRSAEEGAPTMWRSRAANLAIPVAAVSLVVLGLGPMQARGASGSGGGGASSASGTSVQADFNGDAFADLAVGVPSESVGPVASAGAVNVIYGSPSGLSAKVVPDQFWHQDRSNVEEAAQEGDAFGTALAAGDFNGDGFTDLAVGVPNEDIGSIEDAGAVNVIFGSPSGLSATSTPDRLWHQDSANVADSAEPRNRFGTAVAAANFGGGSESDLAVGASWEEIGSISAAGAVNVIYGSPSGLSATTTPDQLWHQNSANVEEEAERSDFFGAELATGNFGGSSQADLAVGAPLEDIGSVESAGAVNVIYGSPAGLSATTTPDQLWHQDSPDVEEAAEFLDEFGLELAAADFGGSSKQFSDLAVGAPREDIGFLQDAGTVHVIYGSPSGLEATVTPDQLWNQNSANVEDSAEDGDVFGGELAAADFGASSQAELAVGVPFEDIGFQATGTVELAGAVNVIYGSPAGLSATTTADQIWHQNIANVEEVAEFEDVFGRALATADFGGSPQADLAVGVPHERVDSVPSAGAVNVIYGSSAGLSATTTPDQLWHQDSPDVEDAAETGERFGEALAAIT